MSNLIKKHSLIAYYVLTLVISWLIWLPLIASAQGWIHTPIPFAIHYLGAFGPMLASMIVTRSVGGAKGLKELFSRITRWRVGWLGLLGAIGSPIALFVLAAVAVGLMGGGWPNLALLGVVNYLPDLGVGVLLLWLATYGFGEEIGWRGFALPRLQNGRSALAATLILGLMWSLWHVPAYFYLDTYMKLGLSMFPLFAVGILCGAIVLTWLYNTANGSVLMVAVWHALFDLLTAAKISDGPIQSIMSALIMVLAVVIVIVYKPANLSRSPRHTLPADAEQSGAPSLVGGQYVQSYR